MFSFALSSTCLVQVLIHYSTISQTGLSKGLGVQWRKWSLCVVRLAYGNYSLLQHLTTTCFNFAIHNDEKTAANWENQAPISDSAPQKSKNTVFRQLGKLGENRMVSWSWTWHWDALEISCQVQLLREQESGRAMRTSCYLGWPAHLPFPGFRESYASDKRSQ